MKKTWIVMTALLFGGVMSLAWQSQSVADDQAAALQARVFEMRVYTANDGKMDELHARFRDHTNTMFVKHGMDLIGYWTPTEGDEAENTLIYVLGHESRDAAKASWRGFMVDPDWQKAYKESIADGKLLKKVDSKFMAPTDYSPVR